MKTKMIMIVMMSAMLGTTGFGNPTDNQFETTSSIQQTDSSTFKVYGKCGMCKKRIEKAANELDGVSDANWDVDSKEFTAQYDAAKVSEKEIQEKIASVGHDTEKVKATDKAYNDLPGCCKYDRPAEN
ncbi:heavy-metal-associated domain-containing protein [Cyclobacterium marinum]|uniref:heavy-metal-associated domain-containing protein n=1 Tax=Cyclobacterium marinum TaxID=104 RepID=UPI0011F0255C|nr:heavy-metal-associated domain-containing protein [Cyclobacterium marinum]MBI0398056.1 heavy-metal-associated domain-containing protein [Cyclobacterium marinum]